MPKTKLIKILKNGRRAGYVQQKDGSWKWSFLKNKKSNLKNKKGGSSTNIILYGSDTVVQELLNWTYSGTILGVPCDINNSTLVGLLEEPKVNYISLMVIISVLFFLSSSKVIQYFSETNFKRKLIEYSNFTLNKIFEHRYIPIGLGLATLGIYNIETVAKKGYNLFAPKLKMGQITSNFTGEELIRNFSEGNYQGIGMFMLYVVFAGIIQGSLDLTFPLIANIFQQKIPLSEGSISREFINEPIINIPWIENNLNGSTTVLIILLTKLIGNFINLNFLLVLTNNPVIRGDKLKILKFFTATKTMTKNKYNSSEGIKLLIEDIIIKFTKILLNIDLTTSTKVKGFLQPKLQNFIYNRLIMLFCATYFLNVLSLTSNIIQQGGVKNIINNNNIININLTKNINNRRNKEKKIELMIKNIQLIRNNPEINPKNKFHQIIRLYNENEEILNDVWKKTNYNGKCDRFFEKHFKEILIMIK